MTLCTFTRATRAPMLTLLLVVAGLPVSAQTQTQSQTEVQTQLAMPTLTPPLGVPQPCVDGALPSGAIGRICVPLGWNGELVAFAPGYVPPQLPLGFYNLTTVDNTSLPELFESLGFAFATTTYRQNGLAIVEGVDDMRELIEAFTYQVGKPWRSFITGVSEGGLVATLLAEQSPKLFTAGLATCAPIGDFRAQIDYVGNFRVLFDYFFPGVIDGSAVSIPLTVMAGWDSMYAPAITAALAAHPARAIELLKVANAPFDPATPATILNTALDLLRYNIFSTNDAVAKLGGNPFGNLFTRYHGSSNDVRLNARVRRFAAAPTAVAAMRAYETSGQLRIPLVTLHTTGDDEIPLWQEQLYLSKVDTSRRGRLLPIPIFRYGHCTFTTNEVLGAFLLTIAQR